MIFLVLFIHYIQLYGPYNEYMFHRWVKSFFILVCTFVLSILLFP